MHEPGLIESLLWRVRAILRYAEKLPAASVDPASGVGSAEEENLFDQVDAADEFLLGAIMTANPEWRSLSDRDFERRVEAAESRFARTQVPTRQGLINLLEEACQLLDAVDRLSELDDFPGGADTADRESAWAEVTEAKEELESALHSLDPERHRRRLAGLRDPDERIAAAAQAEGYEARSAAWGELNQRMRVLSSASGKFQLFEERAPAAAAELRARLTAADALDDDLVRSLIDATDMTLDEARTFVAHFQMK